MQSVTLSSQTYDKVRDLLGSMTKSMLMSETKSCSMTCQSVSEGEETRLIEDEPSEAKARLRSQARQMERTLHYWTHNVMPYRHLQVLDTNAR